MESIISYFGTYLSLIHILFLRENLQALGEQGHRMGMDGDLSHFRRKHHAFHTYDITNIQLLEILVGILAQIISGHIALDGSFQILNIAERSLSHHPLGHHTSGNGHFFSLIFCILLLHIRAVNGYIVLGNTERILSLCLKFGQFLSAYL